MLLESHEFEHPTQVSHVRLKLYRYQPPAEVAVAGLLPRQPGFHLTEERVSNTTVVATLGFFTDEGEARARLRLRAEQLARQGYRAAATPYPAPSQPALNPA